MRYSLPFMLVLSCLFLGCTSDTPSADTADQTESSADSADSPLTGVAEVDVLVDEPSGSNPVTWGIALDQPTATPGGTVQLVVRAKIADPWHIYAVEGPVGVGRPTKFELTLPTGVSAGEWTLPDAIVESSSLGEISSYHHDVLFSVPLEIGEAAASGDQTIGCKVQFQACTNESCRPPTSTELSASLTVAAK
ncbi:MAG: protein-disulfide reductase DsbD N-terminal domain-containing protein [Planctomycetales bacterium]|nr:protein-disulfide reductase DsbD N-terminal domain-containing protein [Planctomycetales bacterium]